MKKIFIKYNPYKLETHIEVDGKNLAQNSELGERTADGFRLQEWVEELPQLLVNEYNDTEFEVEFHGTLLDYEDLIAVLTDARDRGIITGGSINRKPAKETSDKEVLIDDVFAEIQQGPFDELRDKEIIGAFKHAKSSDFEVCVVATMSAGKSTLINAMLGTKLMPSKQEACTAIITRIKDVSQDDVPFRAEVYDKDDRLAETHERLTYPIMERLNSDESVSEIEVSGNIPFVSSGDVSLVLIDTPGPNNSRDPRHRKVQSELLGKSSKALVLYIMTGEFGTDDDNALLKRVAESMAVGGKQSKDRFIFVVNKLDDRKEEDGDTNQTLERVRSYLKTHGIANPNLFPASALPALNLRLIKSGVDVNEDTVDETEVKVKKLNRNETLHFETYAALPPSLRGEIKGQIETTRSEWKSSGKPANENPEEALIHTGVVSIEAAIRQYVRKYAKTAKIKNIVDTFMHKLDEVGCFEETKRELAANQEESERIVKLIASIQKKIDDAQDAQKFKDAVDDTVAKVNDDSQNVVESIIQKFQARIRKRIDELRGSELSTDDAEDEVERLIRFSKKLEPDFEVELDELIQDKIVGTATALLAEYKKKLASLSEEIEIEIDRQGIVIDPLKLMSGSVGSDEFSMRKFIKEKKVEDGEEYVKNTSKKWYKPWTWFQESGYYRTKYKTIHYVDGSTLAQEFFAPIQQVLSDNGDAACIYAREQSKKIAERFNSEFKRLDNILKSKLTELKSYATDKKRAEERIKESERKLKWLEQIKAKVESILEI
ncbi:MAG: dynamin family protein [Clostridiales Family XIII bacterium]|nr:dynamin family protein [Clostridiales Family XIII bacterium]